jgi:hypothetical protein
VAAAVRGNDVVLVSLGVSAIMTTDTVRRPLRRPPGDSSPRQFILFRAQSGLLRGNGEHHSWHEATWRTEAGGGEQYGSRVVEQVCQGLCEVDA